MPSLQLEKVGEPSPFAEYFREELERRDWTQSSFKYLVGVSASTVSRWYNGEAEPNHENVVAIAKAFGVTVHQVMQHLLIDSRKLESKPTFDTGRREVRAKIDPEIKLFMEDFNDLPKEFQMMVKSILHPIYFLGLSKLKPRHPRLGAYRGHH